jgi:two-component system, NarL family, invasion response regulator UvrY
MIRVLIVDDHIIFREGLKKVLATAADIEVADETGDGREALRKIIENVYDVVLLDIVLPGMDGLDVLRAARERKPALPILVLSMFPEEQYALRVLKEGASGYLTKESVPGELIRAIRRAAQGGKHVSETLGEKLANTLVGKRGEQLHELLSCREYQVFRMIGAGKSVKKIAQELCLAPTTVSSHRAHILEKMRMKNNAELVRYALQHRLIP